ncbi:MAG: redoxin domain-containing protein [Bacteroidetes bacterium]|nr:redoxin domain-containing protein [Bacteroidota bacterium]
MKKAGCLFFIMISCLFSFGQTPTLSLYDSLKVMPPFLYYTLDGKYFTIDSLKSNMKTVEIYFNPKCEHCQQEAQLISDSIKYFPKTQFIFVSRADSVSLKKFASDYHLDSSKFITVLWDKDLLYYTFTIAHYTPSIHIYDEDQRLIYFAQDELTGKELIRELKR